MSSSRRKQLTLPKSGNDESPERELQEVEKKWRNLRSIFNNLSKKNFINVDEKQELISINRQICKGDYDNYDADINASAYWKSLKGTSSEDAMRLFVNRLYMALYSLPSEKMPKNVQVPNQGITEMWLASFESKLKSNAVKNQPPVCASFKYGYCKMPAEKFGVIEGRNPKLHPCAGQCKGFLHGFFCCYNGKEEKEMMCFGCTPKKERCQAGTTIPMNQSLNSNPKSDAKNKSNKASSTSSALTTASESNVALASASSTNQSSASASNVASASASSTDQSSASASNVASASASSTNQSSANCATTLDHKDGEQPSAALVPRFFVPKELTSTIWSEVSLISKLGVSDPKQHKDADYFFCHWCNIVRPKTTATSNGQINQHLRSCDKKKAANGNLSQLASTRPKNADSRKKARIDEGKLSTNSKADVRSTNGANEVLKTRAAAASSSSSRSGSDALANRTKNKDRSDQLQKWVLGSLEALESFVKAPTDARSCFDVNLGVDQIFASISDKADSYRQGLPYIKDSDVCLQVYTNGFYVVVDASSLTEDFQKAWCRLVVIDIRQTLDIKSAIQDALDESSISDVVWTTVGHLHQAAYDLWIRPDINEFALPDSISKHQSFCFIAAYDRMAKDCCDLALKKHSSLHLKVFRHKKEMDSLKSIVDAINRSINRNKDNKSLDELELCILNSLRGLFSQVKTGLDSLQRNDFPNLGVGILTIRVIYQLLLQFDTPVWEWPLDHDGFKARSTVLSVKNFLVKSTLTHYGVFLLKDSPIGFVGLLDPRFHNITHIRGKSVHPCELWETIHFKDGRWGFRNLLTNEESQTIPTEFPSWSVELDSQGRKYYIDEQGTGQWTKPTDEWVEAKCPTSGKPFYKNEATRQSQWEKPEPADNDDALTEAEAKAVLQQLIDEEKKEEKRMSKQHVQKPKDPTSYFDLSANQGYNSSILASRGSVEDFLAEQRKRVMVHGAIEDPFDWWRDEASRKTYPHIATLAHKWLGIEVIVGGKGQNNSALDDVDLSDFITNNRPFS
jgi:WW domain